MWSSAMTTHVCTAVELFTSKIREEGGDGNIERRRGGRGERRSKEEEAQGGDREVRLQLRVRQCGGGGGEVWRWSWRGERWGEEEPGWKNEVRREEWGEMGERWERDGREMGEMGERWRTGQWKGFTGKENQWQRWNICIPTASRELLGQYRCAVNSSVYSSQNVEKKGSNPTEREWSKT